MNPQAIIKSTIGPQRWIIPSATTRGVTYTVTADAETTALTCDCPNGANGKAQCWHLKAVASGLAGRPVVCVTQRPEYRQTLTDSARELAGATEV